MATRIDIYEQWKKDGQLDRVMEFIKDCASKLVTQRDMCEMLHITESTFSHLKKKHPEIQKVINDARLQLKVELFNSLINKAKGYEVVEEEQWIEESDKGTRVKTHKTKRNVGPDFKSIVYLLTKRFGKEYGERYEELLLQEKKLEQSKESWNNEKEQDDDPDDCEGF